MATTMELPVVDAPEPDPRSRHTGGPTPAGWAARAGLVVFLALIAVWYVTALQPVHSDLMSHALVLGVGALSLNVLIGYAGQISLGHQAFIGIGAFASAYALGQQQQPFFVGLAVAAFVGMAQAVILGLVALRVRGLYFALVTLAWGTVGERCIFRIRSFTGGGAGAQAHRPFGFSTDRGFLVVCALTIAVVLVIDWRLLATKAGRAMQALRESPQVAANYGVNVRAYTLFAFAVSGFYAGIAGGLFASRRLTVQAVDFSFTGVALTVLIITVVGGLRRRGGIVLFSIFYALGLDWLPELAKGIGVHNIEVNAGYYIQLLSGVLAVLTLIFQPEGLGTFTAPVGRWLKGGSFSLHGDEASAGAEGVHARP